MKAISQLWQRLDLPPPDTKRWVASRKAAVLAALKQGVVTRDYILKLYALSDEELADWIESDKRHGTKGLRVTKIQTYRRTEK